MSLIPSGISRYLQFYLSGPMPCPYLPAQIERKLFTRLMSGDEELNTEINSALCRAGFRRSHDVIYRPACTACNACVPVRIPVALFTPSASQKRISARNRDLTWRVLERRAIPQLYDLFMRYQSTRHADSEMAHMGRDDFDQMVTEGDVDLKLYILRDGDQVLRGCMMADAVGDGLSAVYSFFDPGMARRSLGTFLILSLIDEAARQHLPYVYLGYWVAQSPKMAYKNHFRPMQALGAQGWDWLDRPDGA